MSAFSPKHPPPGLPLSPSAPPFWSSPSKRKNTLHLILLALLLVTITTNYVAHNLLPPPRTLTDFQHSRDEFVGTATPWVTALPVDKQAYPRVEVDDLQKLPLRTTSPSNSIALVTIGLKPFTKFGGIGTMFYNYVELYANRGFDVHVYYTADLEFTKTSDLFTPDEVRKAFPSSNIHVYALDNLLESGGGKFSKVYGTKEMERSNLIYKVLNEENSKGKFEAVIFHDYRGIAAATIQAKQAGIAFADTLLVVTCHTSSYNSQFFNARLANENDAVLNELEDYTRNFADVTVFVSHALRDQLHKLSIYETVDTDAKTLVLPNFIYGGMYDELETHAEGLGLPVLQSKFAFFGRIDTLKGIHLFIEAVEIVLAIPLDSEFRGLTGVAIVGNYPLDKKKTQNEEKIEELFSKLRARGIQVEQYNDLMTVEAIDVLRENGYVAVLPSLYENYPMALLEMLSYGVLVIHADAGGQSEVSMNNNNMFRGGDPRDLARFMERAMRDGMVQDTTALSREEVYDGYERVVRIDPHKLRRGAQVAHTQKHCGDVTLGIVTFAKRFVEVRDLIRRLSKQTCPGFKVVVFINSQCDLAPAKCGALLGGEELARDGLDLTIVIPPGGEPVSVSDARNSIIRGTETEYVVLFDDDDVPRSDFVEVMRRAAIVGGGDLVTSHAGFVETRPSQAQVDGNRVDLHHVSLAGGNMGPAANFFVHHTGKANVLMRTSVAQGLGPCIREHNMMTSPFVDWGMYTNFILNKARIVVVPESMYFYQMFSTGSIFYEADDFERYLGAKKIVNKYCEFYGMDVMGCELLWMAKQGHLLAKDRERVWLEHEKAEKAVKAEKKEREAAEKAEKKAKEEAEKKKKKKGTKGGKK